MTKSKQTMKGNGNINWISILINELLNLHRNSRIL